MQKKCTDLCNIAISTYYVAQISSLTPRYIWLGQRQIRLKIGTGSRNVINIECFNRGHPEDVNFDFVSLIYW